MIDLRTGEAATVQFPMVRHAAEIGWMPIAPTDATLKRSGVSGLMFRDELEAALRKFNPWMTDDAIRSVIENLDALPATIEGNRQVLAWLRGERQWFDDEANRYRRVNLIDYETPSNNSFHVTWEWTLRPLARKSNRADVMFLVNGVPVAIVEHKNPKDADAIERGVTQLQRYEIETPELTGMAQIFNVTHLFDYWYGVTWNISRRYMARWKERPEDSYRFAVQSFFEPTDFLRTLQHWILFYVEDDEMRKSVLRQHQRRAVELIIERCSEPNKQRGLIWHTQGSGKTFTLLTSARLILERKAEFRTPSVVVVADRTELEGQLRGWVDRLLGEMQQQDIPVWRAESRAELRDLLQSDKRGLIISMIHKFEGIEKDTNTRDNIYVFIDEAHRSVAKDLGTYLMGALPNATIIGFTGTPIARTEYGEGTFKIFGKDDDLGYLDKYTIAESIEDETTLPIRHTLAPSDLTVPVEQLDKEFFELADSGGVTDIDELNRVLDRAVDLRTFLSADDRVEKVAAFVAEHFRYNVDPLGYKAFLVAVNREACAKYKRALDKHLPAEWSVPIYTHDADDIVKRPLVAELQLSPEREADTRLMFKKANTEPKILIVTDKLLTGFDAPLLYCMYLDKPMRDHVLLQAIARVNRPYVDSEGISKSIGLVVDFVGVLRELKKALQFDSSDVSGAIESLDVLMDDLQSKLEQAQEKYLNQGSNTNQPNVVGDDGEPFDVDGQGTDADLEQLVYQHFLHPDARTAFFSAFKEIEALWEILSPSAELRDHVETFRRLAELYAAVREAFSVRPAFDPDLAKKTKRLVESSARLDALGDSTQSLTFDTRTLERLRRKPGPPEPKVFNFVRSFQRERSDVEPVLRPLKDRAEQILSDIGDLKTSGMQAMETLAALVGEKEAALEAAKKSGLTSRGFNVFWSLKDSQALDSAGISPIGLAREVETILSRFPNAAVNTDEERQLRMALYRPLLDLSGDERARTVDRIIELLLNRGTDGYD